MRKNVAIVIPDTQVKPGVKTDHLTWAGKYIADYQPEYVIHLGDHADMASLSTYEKPGAKYFEGKRYAEDIRAANAGMDLLMQPIARKRNYNPHLHFLLGNHEDRITRAIAADPVKLEGVIDLKQLNYWEWGWTVHPFQKVVDIRGTQFCHMFTRAANGMVSSTKRGMPSASAQLKREMCSSVAGHKQGFDYFCYPGNPNKHAIIAGSFYQHVEDYMGPQGQEHWHGILVLHEMRKGDFDLMMVSIAYLRRRYGRAAQR